MVIGLCYIRFQLTSAVFFKQIAVQQVAALISVFKFNPDKICRIVNKAVDVEIACQGRGSNTEFTANRYSQIFVCISYLNVAILGKNFSFEPVAFQKIKMLFNQSDVIHFNTINIAARLPENSQVTAEQLNICHLTADIFTQIGAANLAAYILPQRTAAVNGNYYFPILADLPSAILGKTVHRSIAVE